MVHKIREMEPRSQKKKKKTKILPELQRFLVVNGWKSRAFYRLITTFLQWTFCYIQGLMGFEGDTDVFVGFFIYLYWLGSLKSVHWSTA